MHSIIWTTLNEFLSENDILGNRQWGLRSLHLTALALIDCSNNWFINIDLGGMISTALLDIEKAFDTIDRVKVDCYGAGDEQLNFLKSYLSDIRKQCCNITNQMSGFKGIKSGVP